MKNIGGAVKELPEKSEFKRWSDRVALGAVIVLVAYALVLSFPDPAFPHQYEGELVTLQAREPIDPAVAREVLEESTRLVLASGLSTHARGYDVVLTSSPAQFALFANRSRRSFAISFAALGTTFVRPADLAANQVRSGRDDRLTRHLSSVIAHEITHHMIREELGLARTFLLPFWKKEGVPDYVAGESTFDVERGLALMRDGATDSSIDFRYFRVRLLVGYLVNHRDMTPAEVLRSDLDSEEVEAELRVYLRQTPMDSLKGLLKPRRFGY